MILLIRLRYLGWRLAHKEESRRLTANVSEVDCKFRMIGAQFQLTAGVAV